MTQNNNFVGKERKIDYSTNYKNTFTDDIMFQIGDNFSKLIFYNYGTTTDSANQIKQDATKKIVNTEIIVPNQVLKNLSYIMYYLFQLKDSALTSIQSGVNQATAEAYMKLSSRINSQYFDIDQSVNLMNFYEEIKQLAESLKLEIEIQNRRMVISRTSQMAPSDLSLADLRSAASVEISSV